MRTSKVNYAPNIECPIVAILAKFPPKNVDVSASRMWIFYANNVKSLVSG